MISSSTNRSGSSRLLPLLLCTVLALALASVPAAACSITAAGTCGGSACPAGETCKKTSSIECKCVKNTAIFRPCQAGEKACELSAGEWVCWGEKDPCPDAAASLATEEQPQSACLVAVSKPGDAPAAGAARGTREVSVSVSGCSGCFKSARIKLPGNVTGVAPLSSHFSGAMNSSGMYWLGDTVWESSCFGNSSGRCGSVRRTYLVAYK